MSSASSVHTTAAGSKGNAFVVNQYLANREKREEYSLKVLQALLDAYPKSVRVDSEGGRLPLHTAVAGRATLSIIETLAKSYPYACRHRNTENSLPLHLAACYGVSDPGVAPMLLKLYPYACVGRNRWERTPLEEALLKGGENGRSHQEALCRALRKPPDYWISGFFGENMTYEELRQSVLRRDDEGKKETVWSSPRYESEMTSNTASLDSDDLFSLIKHQRWDLILQNMDSLRGQASKLTKCEVRGGQIAMVSALYAACEFDPTYEVLDALVNVCPGATTWRKQPGGQLPLHALCTWGGSKEAIGFLIAACPESARKRDDSGNLALHAACYSGASESIIQSLLLCDPKTVLVTNIQGSTPRDITWQLCHRNRKKVLDLIENVSLELLEKKRCHEKKKIVDKHINAQIEKVLEEQAHGRKEKSFTKKSFFKFTRKEKHQESFPSENQQLTSEPKLHITGSPPPEENIEVSMEEESCDDLLWV
jgi:ankyrin repeat protein